MVLATGLVALLLEEGDAPDDLVGLGELVEQEIVALARSAADAVGAAGGATNILLVDPNASVRNLQAFAREVMPSFQTSRYAAAE